LVCGTKTQILFDSVQYFVKHIIARIRKVFNRNGQLLISQFFHLPCDKIIDFPAWQCSNMTETKMDNAHSTPDD
jgi:hypothetical protein